MDAGELYQRAYDAHYRDEDFDAAWTGYVGLIRDYPASAEARYAHSQLENLRKDPKYGGRARARELACRALELGRKEALDSGDVESLVRSCLDALAALSDDVDIPEGSQVQTLLNRFKDSEQYGSQVRSALSAVEQERADAVEQRRQDAVAASEAAAAARRRFGPRKLVFRMVDGRAYSLSSEVYGGSGSMDPTGARVQLGLIIEKVSYFQADCGTYLMPRHIVSASICPVD